MGIVSNVFRRKCQKVMEVGEEPLSLEDALFHTQALNCCIMTVLGFKTEIDIQKIKSCSQNYLMNQPRFRSVLVENRKWMETKVDIKDHIINVDIDPKMEEHRGDEFLENYMSILATKPMDLTKPLWELHVLNMKTRYANSTVLLRTHHSMGDGLSLMSLLLSCCFQTSHPHSNLPPTFPISTKNKNITKKSLKWLVFTIWSFFVLIFNTLVDLFLSMATTISFLKDTETPIKGAPGKGLSPKRFVHRIISLDDIKTVKTALNATVNDVMLGITQGGLSHYLNRRYASNNKKEEEAVEQTNYLPDNIRLRASVIFSQKLETFAGGVEKNSTVKFENSISFVLLPVRVELLDDPKDYVRLAKSSMDRKKLSLESRCTHLILWILAKLLGLKLASVMIRKTLVNTTILFSNVPGPTQEINCFEHPLSYIAPTVYGLPLTLSIHYQSYVNKMVIMIAVDTDVISDPHELCNDIENCLRTIK